MKSNLDWLLDKTRNELFDGKVEFLLMSLRFRRRIIGASFFMGLLCCWFPVLTGFPVLAEAQPAENRHTPMSKDAFNLSISQAALTVCALRKLDMAYKIALKTSAVPVFQLVKFKHGMMLEGVSGAVQEEKLIRFLGYKISEKSLVSCKELLPPGVEASMIKIKTKLGS